MAMSIALITEELELEFDGSLGANDYVPVVGHDGKVRRIHENIPFDLFEVYDGMAADFELFTIAVSHLCSVSNRNMSESKATSRTLRAYLAIISEGVKRGVRMLDEVRKPELACCRTLQSLRLLYHIRMTALLSRDISDAAAGRGDVACTRGRNTSSSDPLSFRTLVRIGP